MLVVVFAVVVVLFWEVGRIQITSPFGGGCQGIKTSPFGGLRKASFLPFCLIKKEPKNQFASLGRFRFASLSEPFGLFASCSFPESAAPLRNAIPL